MDTTLSRSPIYEQLNQRLRTAMAEMYQVGDRFLTERQVSEQFRVSRATANKALSNLVSEGLLEFRRGIGTFVRRDLIDYDVRSLVSFTEKAKTAGKKPTTKLITFELVAAGSVSAEARLALGCEKESQLWNLKRLRMADGEPVILEHRLIDTKRCPKLSKTQARGSLYKAFTDCHSLSIGGADEVIRSISLAASEAKLLAASSRSPALEVVAVGFLHDQTPLWWERTLYRGDRYEFHSRLGPIQNSTPARGQLR